MDEKVLATLHKLKIPVVTEFEPIERIPSGSPSLDYALGGGWPRGRFSTLWGGSSYGKSTTMFVVIANTQRLGGRPALIDTENSYQEDFARKLGVNTDELALIRHKEGEDYAERLLDDIEALIKTKMFDLIVCDSMTGAVPKAQLEGSAEDRHMGLTARVLSQNLPKIKSALAASNTALIFVNQQRVAIGQWAPSGQIPYEETGGEAMRFYAAIRVKLKKAQKIEEGDVTKGIVIRGSTVKNKTSTPYRSFDTSVRWEPFGGIDLSPEMYEMGKAFGIFLNREGQPYAGRGTCFFGTIELGQSKDSILTRLDTDTETANLVIGEIYNRIHQGGSLNGPTGETE